MTRIKTSHLIYSLTIIFILFAAAVNAQNLTPSLSSLRGVNKAGVLVEKVSEILHDNGLKEEDIRKDIIEKLDFAGITVLSNTEMHKVPGSPYLYINIGAVKSKNEDFYAVSISIEFKQDVNLVRNPKQTYYGAATWSVSNIGIFTKDKLAGVRTFTKEMVEKFVKDYLKANKMEETK